MNLSQKIKIGRLDRKVIFSDYTTAQDEYGDAVPTFAQVISTWAAIDYQGPGTIEGIESERETAFNTVTFTIRQRDSFRPTEKMKITFDAFDYDIISIKELAESRKRFWVIAGRKTDANDA